MNDQNEQLPWNVLPDRVYQPVKWLVVIVLPAIGTLYFTLAEIWGLPSATEVMGTLLAFQVFLGVVLGLSSRSYNASEARYDGTLTTTDTDTKKIVSVETNVHPDQLAEKDEVILKVKPSSQ